MKLAVVGAGWAGLAAAVQATQAGHTVTVFEAARTLGGRARSVPVDGPQGQALTLDNGQHILIGAYTATLQLMRDVGVDPDAALHRRPLALQFPDGSGLRCPDAPAPLAVRLWLWYQDPDLLWRGATASNRSASSTASSPMRCECPSVA